MTLNKNPKDRQMLFNLEQELTGFINESKYVIAIIAVPQNIIIRFPKTILKCCQIFVVFFTQKMIKNVFFNETKNTRVRFFSYIVLYVCATFHFIRSRVLKLDVPWRVQHNPRCPPFSWKRNTLILFLFLHNC